MPISTTSQENGSRSPGPQWPRNPTRRLLPACQPQLSPDAVLESVFVLLGRQGPSVCHASPVCSSLLRPRRSYTDSYARTAYCSFSSLILLPSNLLLPSSRPKQVENSCACHRAADVLDLRTHDAGGSEKSHLIYSASLSKRCHPWPDQAAEFKTTDRPHLFRRRATRNRLLPQTPAIALPKQMKATFPYLPPCLRVSQRSHRHREIPATQTLNASPSLPDSE